MMEIDQAQPAPVEEPAAEVEEAAESSNHSPRPEAPSLKRKLSSSSEQEAKRAKVDSPAQDGHVPDAQPEPQAEQQSESDHESKPAVNGHDELAATASTENGAHADIAQEESTAEQPPVNGESVPEYRSAEPEVNGAKSPTRSTAAGDEAADQTHTTDARMTEADAGDAPMVAEEAPAQAEPQKSPRRSPTPRQEEPPASIADTQRSPQMSPQRSPSSRREEQPPPVEDSQRSPRRSPHREEPPRRPTVRDDEKKRSKRLFGGLLGTLAQNPAGGAHRRRAEIEKKQQAKLKAQDEEHEEDRRRRLDRLTRSRQRQSVRWEERAMRERHAGMRARAQMLCTRSEPKIYYKPYELRGAEKDIIEKQIDDREAEIDRELDDLRDREPRREEEPDLGRDMDRRSPTRDADDRAHREPDDGPSQHQADAKEDEQVADKMDQDDTEVPKGQAPEPSIETIDTAEAERDKHDENEDVMVEAGEDSVIY